MRIGVLVVMVLTLAFHACVRTQPNATAPSSSITRKPATTGSPARTPKTDSVTATTADSLATLTTASANVSTKVDFATQIRPILESRCQPCHFSGGKVYDRLPFDRPETIKTLGTKLFTRIKDEIERRLIREFLSQE
jgi:hypothetical protein